jgi:hypothetical protein
VEPVTLSARSVHVAPLEHDPDRPAALFEETPPRRLRTAETAY